MALNIALNVARLDAYNYGTKDYYIEQNKQLILNGFTTHPSYQSVTINGSARDVHIVDDNALTKDPSRKIILAKPNESIVAGEYVVWKNKNWITYQVDDNNDVQDKAELYRCSSLINWIDSNGNIHSYPCVRGEMAKSDIGTSENKYMIVPNRENKIIMQANEYSNSLRERDGTRFIFSEKCFKLHDTEREIYEGLVILSLEEDEINFETDKQVLVNGELIWIADYTKLPVFNVEINQGDIESVSSNTIQLSASVTKDGLTSSENILWSSDDELVATVDSDGLVTTIAEGVVDITATMENNSDISDSISVTVTATPVSNIEYVVSPNVSEITLGDTQIFTVKKYDNGVEVVDAFAFTVDVSTTSGTSDYKFTVIDGNSFSIENLDNNGNVVIKIVPSVVLDEFTKSYELAWF